MAHVLDIEAARRDVAAHQEFHLAALEGGQGLHAHRLHHVAVQLGGVEAVTVEGAVKHADITLAVAEDEGVLDVLVADQLTQGVALLLLAAARPGAVIVPDRDHPLDDVNRRGRRRRHVNFLGVHEEGFAKTPDLGRHGGRKEQGLAYLGRQRDDALDVGDETHVQHAVGFVDDQDLDVVQQETPAPEQVE